MPKLKLNLDTKSVKNSGLQVQNSSLLIQNNGLLAVFVFYIFLKYFKFRTNFKKMMVNRNRGPAVSVRFYKPLVSRREE